MPIGAAVSRRNEPCPCRRSCLRQYDLQSAVTKRQGLCQRLRRSQGAGVTCFISQARKGGWGQPLGLNEDPSNLSVACRQLGPITTDISTLPEKEEAFSEKTSIFFKKTRIYRMPDVARGTIVYLAVSSKLINGSPANAISVVPIMPWPSR